MHYNNLHGDVRGTSTSHQFLVGLTSISVECLNSKISKLELGSLQRVPVLQSMQLSIVLVSEGLLQRLKHAYISHVWTTHLLNK